MSQQIKALERDLGVHTSADAADRVTAMVADPSFADVNTVCVHSDTPNGPAILAAVGDRLSSLALVAIPAPPGTSDGRAPLAPDAAPLGG
ncbi:hypothetical protein ACQPXM_25110 [Kribbella sp. CA-253562]|uniref:hypothetical protein n=1 Tax=Kribbella sp. CA-253562 TaxID=3239942 RepID=UPI003D8EDC95